MFVADFTSSGYTPFLPVRLPSGDDLSTLYRDLLDGAISAAGFARELDILFHLPLSQHEL